MSCELCGRESKGCRVGLIDGVKMSLCPDCLKHGQAVQEVHRPSAVKPVIPRRKPAFTKDVYKDMEKELISDWSEVIKEARKKKGLTREELGFKIGERTVTIAKIENGDLRPSDKMIAKLEKELGITLLEAVKEVTTTRQSSTGFTLGDFIRNE
ncbi:MAG: multiprotein bridging factor aMBF1 [Thermoplasmatota archaeon]